jgi:hypothetical protein
MMTLGLSIAGLRKNIKPVVDIFFRSAKEGWVSNKAPLKYPTLPWAWQTMYYDSPWRVTDTWEKTGWTNQTGGVIRIYFENTPVWMMQYFGAYSPEVIQFLKSALFENYRQHIFIGGRGPWKYRYENLEYCNEIAEDSSFQNFHGIETVWRDGILVGEHRYHGGLMI